MKTTLFAQKFAGETGINTLMDDLGHALCCDEEIYMLGGGNPAHIPDVQRYFRRAMQAILDNETAFERTIGNYDPPEGNIAFACKLSAMLKNQYGWDIGPRNIALTNGSQTAFFILFNLFGGRCTVGFRKILLPLCPEYIGYASVGLEDGLFTSGPPRVELLDDRQFKYHIDFENLPLDDTIGAICVSRPTNPSGNVLTDVEVQRLAQLAAAREIPLIIDSAYGMPFPDIVFTNACPFWSSETIVCMSLSKLGLPMTRTGIVIASEEVVRMIARVNAIISLAPGGMGAALAHYLLEDSRILRISRETIQPFYRQKAETAVKTAAEVFSGLDYRIHKPEGAFFLWLWFPDLPISSQELYERLKKRSVLVVPGHHFFPGLNEPFDHHHQCLRINHAQPEEALREAFRRIAEEVKRA